MSEKDNGGAAFPVQAWSGPNDQMLWPETGMSLRDWFAGQALVALKGTNPNLPGSGASLNDWPAPDQLAARQATWAYLVADAMLAERSK